MNFAVMRFAPIVAACLVGFGWSGLVEADPLSFKVPLSGAREIPPVETPAMGAADITYDTATRVVSWVITYSGLSGPATAAHFHGPADPKTNAGVVVPVKEVTPGTLKGEATLTDAQAADLEGGKWYFNIHTAANPGGVMRGQLVKQ